ncbi:hypothetical protein, partial [Salmonella enterica]|uniref:hypothetical protein n=1 Tax=Salmonella enterica TaxID=28901 RepID=UPI003A5D0E83
LLNIPYRTILAPSPLSYGDTLCHCNGISPENIPSATSSATKNIQPVISSGEIKKQLNFVILLIDK